MSQVAHKPIVFKYPYVRSRQLLDSSKGQVCTFGFHGCSRNAETTVARHANLDICGKGGSIKASDIYSADGCSSCHDVYDGRVKSEYTDDEKQRFFWHAFVRTTNRRLTDGLITVAGNTTT